MSITISSHLNGSGIYDLILDYLVLQEPDSLASHKVLDCLFLRVVKYLSHKRLILPAQAQNWCLVF